MPVEMLSGLFSVAFYLLQTVVMIVICYFIAKNAGISKAYAFLGLLGFVGIVALVIVASRAKMMDAQQRTVDKRSDIIQNYNPNNFQQNNAQFTPYQNANQNNDMQFTANYTESDLNVCHTHDGYEETYNPGYEDYGNYEDTSSGSYNLNGEVVKKGKNICPHCGAKHGIFATHCEECGARL